ncbi:response regulator [Sphingomonas sp. MG17]|jgi:CheY-like chemotaxis protein|uniref:Response regulator n=1 Tax=Sphingomonas tagetis TaxID=2949092 RepID=A0A9X2HWD0_9SPHN|nr:response regulator [Sphingomonas tagetis]MCP3733230.1 response regulator [Sphingomonas tagetis]
MSGSILILFAEDEPLIQSAAEDALVDGGYQVLAASNGQEAIRLLDERIEEIGGLITDVRMGAGPTGWEVARHARSLNPELPVVYTTGDSAADWAAEGVPKSVVVQKPYADAQVLAAISSLMIISS